VRNESSIGGGLTRKGDDKGSEVWGALRLNTLGYCRIVGEFREGEAGSCEKFLEKNLEGID